MRVHSWAEDKRPRNVRSTTDVLDPWSFVSILAVMVFVPWGCNHSKQNRFARGCWHQNKVQPSVPHPVRIHQALTAKWWQWIPKSDKDTVNADCCLQRKSPFQFLSCCKVRSWLCIVPLPVCRNPLSFLASSNNFEPICCLFFFFFFANTVTLISKNWCWPCAFDRTKQGNERKKNVSWCRSLEKNLWSSVHTKKPKACYPWINRVVSGIFCEINFFCSVQKSSNQNTFFFLEDGSASDCGFCHVCRVSSLLLFPTF